MGASVSKQIKQNKNDDSRYRSDDYAANGYVSYDTKYNAGTVSVSRSSQHSSNYSLSSQGNWHGRKKMFMSAKALKPQAWW